MRDAEIYGKKFVVTEEPADLWKWISEGKWERSTFLALDKFLTPDSVFVDVGAWVGTMTLYASRICKQVLAFEPDPVAYHVLCANLRANEISNATAKRCAISDAAGDLKLGASVLGCSTTRLGCAENSITVRADTLSAQGICSGKHVVLKVDAEGAEHLIFRDTAFFGAHKPDIILSLHHKWWHEARVNVAVALETIRKVARTYSFRYDTNFRPVDIEAALGADLILTENPF